MTEAAGRTSAGDVRVRFLGTGGPFAAGGRLQSAILVESGRRRYLIDCGMTALVGMNRFDVDPGSIDGVLITHLHGDHFGGLPLLIFESVANERFEGATSPRRTRPLRVAGPPETEERVREVLELFGWRTPFRSMKQAGLLEFVTLEPRRETIIDDATVTAFPVLHTPEALAVRVRIGGKTIAYSGDTAWTDDLIEIAAEADLFVCVSYTLEPSVRGLLSYSTLEEHRAQLSCRRLILTHVGGEMLDRIDEVNEEVATDGLVITL